MSFPKPTALHIGNFKAFAETQMLPIKPLTLIFGPNSVGKSSVLHALLLLQHIIKTGNVDAYRIFHGEQAVDLGGFGQYVHKHDSSLQVDLAVELGSGEAHTLQEFEHSNEHTSDILLHLKIHKAPDAKEPALAGIQICVQDNWPHAELAPSAAVPNTQLTQPRDSSGKEQANRRALEEAIQWAVGDDNAKSIDSETQTFLFKHADVLEFGWKLNENEIFRECLCSGFIVNLFYLGPLRHYPSRSFLRLGQPEPNYYSSGLFAWDQIRWDDCTREAVNRALRKIGIPYKLEMQEWVNKTDPTQTMRDLVLIDPHGTKLSHRDVGAGISQVLPVVIGPQIWPDLVFAIEQPELHLHPALQAELGDLFIDSALGKQGNTLLLETHSEHLILRILRRVRETTEGKLPAGTTPVRPEDVSVVFVEPTSQGSVVRQLPVTPDGDFGAPWPGGFFAERFQDLP